MPKRKPERIGWDGESLVTFALLPFVENPEQEFDTASDRAASQYKRTNPGGCSCGIGYQINILSTSSTYT